MSLRFFYFLWIVFFLFVSKIAFITPLTAKNVSTLSQSLQADKIIGTWLSHDENRKVQFYSTVQTNEKGETDVVYKGKVIWLSEMAIERIKKNKGNPNDELHHDVFFLKFNLKKNKWEGRVEVLYYVDPAGFVEKIQLKKSSGHKVLDNTALRALSRYRYEPGQEGWVRHPVEFFLELDKEVTKTAPLGVRDPAESKTK